MKRRILFLITATLVACGEEGEPDEPVSESAAETTEMKSRPSMETARSEIRDAQGRSLGVVELEETDFGVKLSGTLTGLSPGEHGFHIHETGLCDPPAFESAGAHYAPLGRRHGFHDPQGPHAGDLRNLLVSEAGSTLVDAADSLVTLREGANTLLDADGSALIVHAEPDDYRSQPSGNSGDRVACGVIAR